MSNPQRLAAARQSRYAARERAKDPVASRTYERSRDQRQRLKLIQFLDGECCRCGLRDHRGLVIVQPAGQRQTLHQIYTLMLHEPEIASAELRLLCATCRQIELFERGRHHEPTVSPSISSPEVQPSVSDVQPSSSTSTRGFGAARVDWGCSDGDGVAFG